MLQQGRRGGVRRIDHPLARGRPRVKVHRVRGCVDDLDAPVPCPPHDLVHARCHRIHTLARSAAPMPVPDIAEQEHGLGGQQAPRLSHHLPGGVPSCILTQDLRAHLQTYRSLTHLCLPALGTPLTRRPTSPPRGRWRCRSNSTRRTRRQRDSSIPGRRSPGSGNSRRRDHTACTSPLPWACPRSGDSR